MLSNEDEERVCVVSIIPLFRASSAVVVVQPRKNVCWILDAMDAGDGRKS